MPDDERMTKPSGEERKDLISTSESEAGSFFFVSFLSPIIFLTVSDCSSHLMRVAVCTLGGAADAGKFDAVGLLTSELREFAALRLGEFFGRLVSVQEGRVAF